jgi:hypothetical protein
MKVVGSNRLGSRQVPWSTIKRKGKKWSILYRLHSGRSPRLDWAGLAADFTSRILRLVPVSVAFRTPNALGRRGGIAWIVRMGNAQQNRWHCPSRVTPKVLQHGIHALLVRDGRLHTGSTHY